MDTADKVRYALLILLVVVFAALFMGSSFSIQWSCDDECVLRGHLKGAVSAGCVYSASCECYELVETLPDW